MIVKLLLRNIVSINRVECDYAIIHILKQICTVFILIRDIRPKEYSSKISGIFYINIIRCSLLLRT